MTETLEPFHQRRRAIKYLGGDITPEFSLAPYCKVAQVKEDRMAESMEKTRKLLRNSSGPEPCSAETEEDMETAPWLTRI
jgi:hypothetical protein